MRAVVSKRPQPPPTVARHSSSCYGDCHNTSGDFVLCLRRMCFLTSHGSPHQPEKRRSAAPTDRRKAGRRLVQRISSIRGGERPSIFHSDPCSACAGPLLLSPGSEDGGSAPVAIKKSTARRRLPRTCPVSLLLCRVKTFVILGGGSFKENAAMRPSDAFEASIIEGKPWSLKNS